MLRAAGAGQFLAQAEHSVVGKISIKQHHVHPATHEHA